MRLRLLLLLALAVVLSGLLELKRKPRLRNYGEPDEGFAVESDTLHHSVRIAI